MSKLLSSSPYYISKYHFSPQLAMDLSHVEQLTSVVCEDVNIFFNRQSWLNNVRAFISSYSSTSGTEFLLPRKFKVSHVI